MMRKPDFFIVGAPKCGTTAMHEYLRQHPEIAMSEVKEPYYFGSDLVHRLPKLTEQQYLNLFKVNKKTKRVGEATPLYLMSKTAAYEIIEFNRSARIIIMLRNPVDMMYSLHSQLLKTGDEDIEDFNASLEAEQMRKAGRQIPIGSRYIACLFYRSIGKYTDQVRRFFEVFGRQNVRVIIFDDFKADTSKIYRETLCFLNVDKNQRPASFNVINPNEKVRSVLLRDLLRSSFAQLLCRTLLPYRRVRWSIRERLDILNRKKIARQPMNQAVKCRLNQEFLREVESLSELLGRDLTYWCHS